MILFFFLVFFLRVNQSLQIYYIRDTNSGVYTLLSVPSIIEWQFIYIFYLASHSRLFCMRFFIVLPFG